MDSVPDDVREGRSAASILAVERGLALRLLALQDPQAILDACLDAAVALSRLECGGIYLADPVSGRLELACHTGVSLEFAASAGTFPLDCEPLSAMTHPVVVHRGDLERAGLVAALREGLSGAVAVPVHIEGVAVACLAVASRMAEAIPSEVILGLESVAAQMGTALARARAEQLRQQSEETHRLLVEASPCSILVVQDGRFVYANPYAATALGYRAEELLQIPVLATVHPDSRDAVLQRMQGVAQGKPNPPLAIKVLRKDGAAMDTEGVSVPIMFRGRPAVLVVGRDVTASKLAEERIRLLAELLDASPTSTTVHDHQGNFVYANEKTFALHGFSREEFFRMNLHQLDVPDSERLIEPRIREILEKGAASFEVRHRRKDGTTIPLRVDTKLAHWDGQEVFLSVAFDVSDLKRTEQALRERETRLRGILDAVSESVLLIDCEGIVLECNETAARRLGSTVEHLVGRSFYDALPAETAQSQRVAVHRVLQSRAALQFEDQRAGGWFETTVYPVFDDDGAIAECAVFAHDVTERKRAEQEKLEMERRLLHAQKLESLGILAGGIAHDFNNILAAIMGYADLVGMRLHSSDPAREDLEVIQKAAQRAADLTRQMLAYSGKGKFLVQRVDLSQVVADTRKMLEVSVSKKAVMTCNLATGLPAIEADPAQIHQVVLNLVVNASEALGDHSGAIAINTSAVELDEAAWAAVTTGDDAPAAQYVCLEVRDTGCGMDPETLARIFDPFFTTKFLGRGLGLAALHGIVRGHKGGIRVASQPGAGTAFQVFFPACPASPKPQAVEAAMPSWEGNGTVLVVDDEEMVRNTAMRLAEHAGFSVLAAQDGEEAIRVYRQHQAVIVCVILDLTMPKMNGEEALRELRKINPNLCAVLSSGFSEDHATERFSNLALAGFIQKPYQLDSLTATLRKALARCGNEHRPGAE